MQHALARGYQTSYSFLSQKATLVVLILVLAVISSKKIRKAFLIRSRAQRNFEYTFIFPADSYFLLIYRLRFSADVTLSFL